MTAGGAGPRGTVRREEGGPPCRRCGGRSWEVERRPKGRLRRLVETIIAAPDVWIFQSESGGWPDKQSGLWICRSCGRRVRL